MRHFVKYVPVELELEKVITSGHTPPLGDAEHHWHLALGLHFGDDLLFGLAGAGEIILILEFLLGRHAEVHDSRRSVCQAGGAHELGHTLSPSLLIGRWL